MALGTVHLTDPLSISEIISRRLQVDRRDSSGQSKPSFEKKTNKEALADPECTSHVGTREKKAGFCTETGMYILLYDQYFYTYLFQVPKRVLPDVTTVR
jgi:hypothetical protein